AVSGRRRAGGTLRRDDFAVLPRSVSAERRRPLGEKRRRPLYESGGIAMSGNRAQVLARLEGFVRGWGLGGRVPCRPPAPAGAVGGGPLARSQFQWALDRQFLLQRTEIPVPEAPDSLAIVGAERGTGAYTQHYYDSRGIVRVYVMTLADGVWTL